MKIKTLRDRIFTKPPGLKWMLNGLWLWEKNFVFCVFGLLFLNISCNKSSGVNENKAYVTVTHVAPGFLSLNVLYNGVSILGDSGLSYSQTSGDPLNPYVESTAGVRPLLIAEGKDTVLEGNTAFQQGLHYSLFLYDTLKNDSLKMFILQDNVNIRTDTFTNVRFINFSPGSNLNLVLTSKRDTIATGFQIFAGNKLKPSYYTFQPLHIGSYAARVYRDSSFASSIPVDSLQVSSRINYTIFLQGYADSVGELGLKLRSIRHN